MSPGLGIETRQLSHQRGGNRHRAPATKNQDIDRLPPVVLECLTLCGASQQPHLTEMEAEVDTEEPSVVLIATARPVMGCASVHAQSFSPVRLFATSWTIATRLLCPWGGCSTNAPPVD